MTVNTKTGTFEKSQSVPTEVIEQSIEAYMDLMTPVTNKESKSFEDIILSNIPDKYKSLL